MKKIIIIMLILVFAIIIGVLIGNDSKAGKVISNIDDNTINVIKPTIKFVTNGGSKVDSQVTNVVKNAPKTTRENYYFEGWYLDKDFKAPAIFPLSVEYDTTLYAKWLKIYDTTQNKDRFCISGKLDFPSSKSFNITPSGFDFEALSAIKDLKLQISVSYDVYFSKEYNVLWDIGYAGAPHYEIYILGQDLRGSFEEDIVAPSSRKTKTITMCTSVEYFINNTISLTFSTNNIQNAVWIENIVVTYSCGK